MRNPACCRSLVVLGVVAFLGACGGGGGGSSTPEPPEPPPPPTVPPPPPPPPPEALANPIVATIEVGEIQVDAVKFVRAPETDDIGAPGGTNNVYARIQYIKEAPDDSGRMFFNDNRGVLYVTDKDGADPVEYIDLRERSVGFSNVAYPNESGFMGFALHPDFGDDTQDGHGRLYVAFSASPSSGTADFIEESSSVEESVVYEFTSNDPTANTFQGSQREILRIGQFAANHNIGNLAFNPNAERDTPDFGALYIGLGDGGGANDPRNYGQDKQSPLGAILRIDPLGGTEGESEYGIPSDNPFVDAEDTIDEIWAYGLRHPQNFSWDTDGTMYIFDIGQDEIEEVNIGVAGGNYGWRLREGTFATAFGVDTNDSPGSVYNRGDDSETFTYPVAQYDHDEGYAIGSGFVYRGEDIPALVGKLVFSELVRGRVLYVEAENLEPDSPAFIQEIDLLVDGTTEPLLDVAGITSGQAGHGAQNKRVDLRISLDSDGEMYLLTKGDGWIRKLQLPSDDE